MHTVTCILLRCTMEQKAIRVCHVDNTILIVTSAHNDTTYEELDFSKCYVLARGFRNIRLQKFACWIRHVGLSTCNNNSNTAERIGTFVAI